MEATIVSRAELWLTSALDTVELEDGAEEVCVAGDETVSVVVYVDLVTDTLLECVSVSPWAPADEECVTEEECAEEETACALDSPCADVLPRGSELELP